MRIEKELLGKWNAIDVSIFAVVAALGLIVCVGGCGSPAPGANRAITAESVVESKAQAAEEPAVGDSQKTLQALVLTEPPADLNELAKMLPLRPEGFGPTIDDRAAWEELAKKASFSQVLEVAKKLLITPLPESPDRLFLDYSRTGNRTRWEAVARERRNRTSKLTIAECLEDKGRFIPALVETLEQLCSEKTWVAPAHDLSLQNFNGELTNIDLFSSAVAAELSQAMYMLGDRLDKPVREMVRGELDRRILKPFDDMVDGRRVRDWWMNTTNNWNAVCLALVTNTALATVESRTHRAKVVAAAAAYSQNFLDGFTADGYCTEGIGYWNYGFGNYINLVETVYKATRGKVDLLARDAARRAATFGARIEITEGVNPAFTDCRLNAKANPSLMGYVNRRLGLGLSRYNAIPTSTSGRLNEIMMYASNHSASQIPPVSKESNGPDLRTWFEHAGVLISRPQPGSDCRLAVAMKGGNNGEHHNHNDIGSYVLVLGKQSVLLDPGGEVYTARTFSAKRYESNVLNSLGHPVPRIAGQLQIKGKEAKARVVRTEFTDAKDTLEIDYTSAYAVPKLLELKRTFIYSRAGAGSLTVTDVAKFSSPVRFGTALITLGKFRKQKDGSLRIHSSGEAVKVQIHTSGVKHAIRAKRIDEDMLTPATKPLRIGIDLVRPVKNAEVTLVITPSAHPLKTLSD